MDKVLLGAILAGDERGMIFAALLGGARMQDGELVEEPRKRNV